MKHGNLSVSSVSDGANSVGGTQYANTYDANGNLAKAGENRHYEWNVNDKLAVFKNQAGSSTPTVYTNYFYNAQGERVKKHTRKGNKVTVTVYMDGGMFEVSYVKPTGTDIDNNRFYNTLHVLDETSRIATVRIGSDADDPTPQVKYCLEDHLMDSLVVLNTQGNLVNREEYYPFGETSFGGFAKKRYRFNGKEKDEESGLYYYGARYYAPWLCRFISVDPAKEQRAWLTPYNYVQNNPINLTDPTGALDDGGGDPVKKGDTFVGDDGKTYTASIDEVVITGTKSQTNNQETKTEAAENLSPTSFTYTLDYEANSSNIPFVESYRHAAGTFTNVLETGEVSDFVEGDTGGGFNITLRVPKIYPHNRDNPTFTTYTGTGSDLDNLTWEKETSLGQAFVDGFNAGWRVGLSTAIQEELATAILFKRFNLSNAKSFEGADPELLRVFFKKKGWKINPTQNRGFRATNPNDKYDVFHIVRGNASKLKPDSNIPKVKQGDYLKRPADKLWPERTPLKRNPALN